MGLSGPGRKTCRRPPGPGAGAVAFSSPNWIQTPPSGSCLTGQLCPARTRRPAIPFPQCKRRSGTGSGHAASTGQSRSHPRKPHRRARGGEPRETPSQARQTLRVRGSLRDTFRREPMAPGPRLACARRPVREGPGEAAHADHHPAPHPRPFRRRLPGRGGEGRGDAVRDPRVRLRYVRLPPSGPRPDGVRGRSDRHRRFEERTPCERGHGVSRLSAVRPLRLREGRSRDEAPRRRVRFGKGVLFQLDGGHLLPHQGTPSWTTWTAWRRSGRRARRSYSTT